MSKPMIAKPNTRKLRTLDYVIILGVVLLLVALTNVIVAGLLSIPAYSLHHLFYGLNK